MLSISGRSFLYHQILSMVGLVIGVVCAALPEAQLDAALSAECGVPVPAAAVRSDLSWPLCAFCKDLPRRTAHAGARLQVPVAPASNLVLAECCFRACAYSPPRTIENVRGPARPSKCMGEGEPAAAEALAVGTLEKLHTLLWTEVCGSAPLAAMGAFSASLASGGFDMRAPTGAAMPPSEPEHALEHLRIASSDECESD